jgi:peroxiredoxin
MKLRTITPLLLTLVIIWCGNCLAVGVGDPLPDIEAETLDGKKFSSKALIDDKSIFVVFWTTWCPQCLLEIPKIKKSYSEYAPKGMSFVAVNAGVNDSEAKAKKYVERFEIPYPVVFDTGSKITRKLGVKGVPTVIIVDKNGVIRYRANLAPENLGEHFEKLMK